ncbi:MAG TPA: hypothetical protein VF163_16240 [Micromonosporaceae bacterium]
MTTSDEARRFAPDPDGAGPVQVYVDAWDPSYGSGLDLGDGGPTGESAAPLGLDIELPPSSWTPLRPPERLRAPDVVLLVDGVRRIDARVWVEEPSGTLHPGIAVSYAAGVVRCDLRHGSAEVAGTRIARGLFTPSPDAVDLSAGNTRYCVCRVAVKEPSHLVQAVQPQLQRLEVEVSHQARADRDDDNDLLILDGRLRDRVRLPRALGYIKTHHQQYLPAELHSLVGRMQPGQRSPVFLLGARWQTYTWYLKLPGPAGSPWAGVVRVEASADLARGEVIHLADLSATTLPRFASTAYKDARAPQNLTPIAGLERRLRGMLGDQRLLVRSLTAAAAAQRNDRPAAAFGPGERGGDQDSPAAPAGAGQDHLDAA